MSRRAVSPARSDAEVDIFDALYTDDIENSKPTQATVEEGFDFLDDGHDEEDDDGDAAFIALKQAASYRKTSNMKTRAAKKSGGGFQSMGTWCCSGIP